MTGEAILRTVAEQIGCLLKPGVAPSVQLQSYLRTRHLLLILDNFEHLVGGVDAFVAVLTQTPGLKALVTSRIRLNVRGETVLSLKKLSLPTATYLADVAAQTNAADMMQDAMWQVSEAVAMFVQRIQQSDPFFTVNAENLVPIEQICQLVDGLPLGIELATSMLPLISCAQLAEELAKNLDFLVTDMRDLPKDQRSLGAVFERSWRLLSAEGQALLAKLSIFPGSFQRTAAEQIAGASLVLLGRLLDQSLLMKADDDRYILHHTIHSFAGQKLTQGLSQRTKLQEQFVQFYLDILARQERALSGDVYAPALAHIQADLDNIRTAWHWCIDQENLAVLGRSLDGLREFYQITGNYAEVIQLLEAALPVVRRAAETPATSAATDATPTGTPVESQNKQRLLGRLLCTLARFYRLYPRLGQVNKGERLAQEALALGRRLIDPEVQGLAYHELARLAQARRDYAAMRQLAEQGYVHGRQANMPQLTAESLNDLGVASGISAHPRAALPYLCEALTYLQRQPKRTLEVRVLGNLEYFHLVSHDYQAALDYMQRTHELRRQLPFRESSLLMLIHFGDLWRALGEYDAACAEYKQGLSLIATQRAPYWECWFYTSYGRLQHLRGDPAAAVDAYRHAHQIAQKDDIHTVDHFTQINWGHALADLGDPVAAAACYERAIAHQIAVNSILRTPDAHAGLAALALARNAVADAVTHTEAVLALLAEHDLDIAGEPFLIYSTCVRVLQAADDPRAQTVLAIAYRRLQEIAHALKEEHLRRSFLEHVVANRKLVDAACAAGLDR
ncbi:MAG: hypothetical protein R2932_29340 [Caldilineaceae bacterium]